MNLIKSQGENLLFEMGQREKRLFLDVLKLYPLIPSSHHRVSRSRGTKGLESNQRLLEEALAEQREENKKQLQSMLNEEGRFKPVKTGFQLALSLHQTEWLLQVLNDIRVGSWLILGEPDEKNGKRIQLTPENTQYFFAMEACAYIQCVLLGALEDGRPSK